MGWVAGERVTQADRDNDTKSLERRLDDRLLLIFKGTGEALSADLGDQQTVLTGRLCICDGPFPV